MSDHALIAQGNEAQGFGGQTLKTTSDTERLSEPVRDPHAEEVIISLMARAFATVDLTTATVKLAAAETRLALSSAGLIVGFVAVLLVMVLVTWLVALATVFAALQALGMSALLSLGSLLLSQLVICALLAYALIRLSRNLTFPLTRQALRPSADS